MVALKKMRLDAHDEGVPVTTLREVALLQDLHHENIVRLREVPRQLQPAILASPAVVLASVSHFSRHRFSTGHSATAPYISGF